MAGQKVLPAAQGPSSQEPSAQSLASIDGSATTLNSASLSDAFVAMVNTD